MQSTNVVHGIRERLNERSRGFNLWSKIKILQIGFGSTGIYKKHLSPRYNNLHQRTVCSLKVHNEI